MLRTFARVAAVGAAITAPIGAYAFLIRPWARTWGVDPTLARTILPGDDIVPDATAVETRAITIDADVADVWPWLLQMGYGRAGFYSYDRLDTRGKSADDLVPEWQTLAVGGTLPTHPTGGFEVRSMEPNRSLVLYVDSVMAEAWAKQAEAAEAAADAAEATIPPAEPVPVIEAPVEPVEGAAASAAASAPASAPLGVRGSGAILGTTMPSEFAGTWAFVLEPMPEGTTRLVERLRFRFGGEEQPARKVAMGALGFGIFLMMRKQLLGIRDRAEHLAQTQLPVPYTPPATAAPPDPTSAPPA